MSIHALAKKLRPRSDARIIYEGLAVGTRVKVYYLTRWYSATILHNDFSNEKTEVLWEKENTTSVLSWSRFGTQKNVYRCTKKMAWKLSPNIRRHTGIRTRLQILCDQEYRCNTCQVPIEASADLDHRVPLSVANKTGRDNLQYLCRDCHVQKTKNESKFRAKLRN